MIVGILNLLAFLGIVPKFLVPLLPLITKNAPLFEDLISGIMTALAVIQKEDPNLIHDIIVSIETKDKNNTTIKKILTTATISGYNANGEVIQIPNPDLH